ncbi:MAG: phosphate acyltransferase PlsX [Elusimicrobiales bacterium]|nr:phosphate acyltransferase PlsX [Elusimicrobiales bacterium]
MKIAIDAHGGDFGISPNVKAAIKAISQLNCEIILVGREDEIKKEFKINGYNFIPQGIKIFNTSQIIEMGKEPVEECKNKPNSSMVVGCELVAEKNADAFISAGNSGAVMVASLLKIGRIKGISRPAIAVLFPTRNGTTLILDAGANTEVKPFNLVQFAIMGTVFFKNVIGKQNPTVGILSIGEEETKGNSLVLESIPLLKNTKHINFLGPVEGRDIPDGKTDIVVCDGFVGNIVLKLSEGIAKFVKDFFISEISKSIKAKIGALLLKNIFKKFKDKTDPQKIGGALLLGVDGVVIICHGNSNEHAIFNAIRTAKEAIENKIIEKTKSDIEDILEKTQITTEDK